MDKKREHAFANKNWALHESLSELIGSPDSRTPHVQPAQSSQAIVLAPATHNLAGRMWAPERCSHIQEGGVTSHNVTNNSKSWGPPHSHLRPCPCAGMQHGHRCLTGVPHLLQHGHHCLTGLPLWLQPPGAGVRSWKQPRTPPRHPGRPTTSLGATPQPQLLHSAPCRQRRWPS